jgi:hypothetical protein
VVLGPPQRHWDCGLHRAESRQVHGLIGKQGEREEGLRPSRPITVIGPYALSPLLVGAITLSTWFSINRSNSMDHCTSIVDDPVHFGDLRISFVA